MKHSRHILLVGIIGCPAITASLLLSDHGMRRRKSVKYTPDNCVFCFTSDVEPLLGPMLEKDGTRMHTNCIFTASGISQETEVPSEDSVEGFQLQSIACEVKRGSRLCCSFCRKLGACIGCAITRCVSKYHLPCLIKAKGFTLFRDPFPSYCRRHAPRQDLQPWLKLTEEPPSCCVCLFPILPDDNSSPGVPAETACNSMPPPPRRQISLSTPVRSTDSLKRVGRPPRRSCVTMSTPKRIRVSYGMSSIKQRLSLSNTSSTWELPDSSPEPDYRHSSPPKTKSSNSNADPSNLPAELHQLPNWFSEYLLNLPDTDRLPTYEAWLHDTVHGCCCPKSWMHRNCIAGFAVSAALHFIKCPYCADKELFIPSIIEAGIWIPDRDAAWELEPGAFADLEPTTHSSEDGVHHSGDTDSNVTNANTSRYMNATSNTHSREHSDEATFISGVENDSGNTERRAPRGRRASRPLTLKPPTRTRRGRPRRNYSEQKSAETVDSGVVKKDDKPPHLFSLVWSNDRFSSRGRSSGRAKRRSFSRRHTQATRYNNHLKSPISEEPVYQQRRGCSRRPISPTSLRSPNEGRMRQSTLGDFLHRYGIDAAR